MYTPLALLDFFSGEGGRDGNQEIVPRQDVQQEIVYKHDEKDRTNKDIINKLRSELQAGFLNLCFFHLHSCQLQNHIQFPYFTS